jgi:hypothetical protein
MTRGGWYSQGGYGGLTPGSGVGTIATYVQSVLGTNIHGTSTSITSITIDNPGGLGGVKIQTGFGNTSDRYNGNVDDFWIQVNSGQLLTYDFEYNPEPATFLRLGVALAGLSVLRWRRKRN